MFEMYEGSISWKRNLAFQAHPERNNLVQWVNAEERENMMNSHYLASNEKSMIFPHRNDILILDKVLEVISDEKLIVSKEH